MDGTHNKSRGFLGVSDCFGPLLLLNGPFAAFISRLIWPQTKLARRGARVLALAILFCSVAHAQTVATPAISPTSGTSYVQFNVTVTDATSGASIYYTLDGTTPTTSSSTVTSGGTVLISQSETLKAYAVKTGYADSAVLSATYQVTGQVAPGWYDTLALKSDGSVWSWGENSSGELGDGTTTTRVSAIQVASLSGITEVAAGAYHSVALKNDGTVWTWGLNSNGQLGDNTTTQRTTPVQVKTSNGSGGTTPLTNIVAIAAGAYHSLALDSSGTVWAWGLNSSGQLGDGTTTQRNMAVQITGITGAIIGAGAYHSLLVTTSGTVYAWGINNTGQIGDGTTTTRTSPVSVTTLSGVSIIGLVGGVNHTLALQSNGTMWAWGQGSGGQLGNNSSTQQNYPVHVTGISGITQLSAGQYMGMALRNDGTVLAWGQALYGQTGNSQFVSAIGLPTQMTGVSGAAFVGTSGYHTVVLKNDGTVWVCGYNNSSQLGTGYSETYYSPLQVLPYTSFKSITPGLSALLKSDGTVWSMGDNLYGCLGDGTVIAKTTPVQASGLTNVVGIYGSTYSTNCFAKKSDGTIWAWGWNQSGQLGDGTNTNRSTPEQIGASTTGFTSISTISAGYGESYALKSDGTVWAWGDNSHGQLGDGTTSQRKTPIQMPTLSGVTAISDGGYHTFLALKNDGTVWGCGDNASGLLTDGTTTDRSTPVQIVKADGTPLTNIVAIQNGSACIALDSTGHVWGWGGGGYVGDGTTTNRPYPVQLSGLSGVVALAGYGGSSTFAFKNDGTLWTWGGGYIGVGSWSTHTSPYQVTVWPGAVAITGNNGDNLFLKEDGHLECVGTDNLDRLGTVDCATAFPIAGFNATALTPTPTASITTPGNNTTVTMGTSQTFTATASETGGTIASVQYYLDSAPLGSPITASPYTLTWTPPTYGNFTVCVVATDTTGHTSYRSSKITLQVPYDSDSNGLPDWWEMKYFGSLAHTASSSPDGNGSSLLYDYQHGLDPANYYSQLDASGNPSIITPILSILSGNNQTSTASAFTPSPLVVKVTNSSGAVLTNAPVTFAVASGGGQISATSGGSTSSSLSLTTDSGGQVQAYYLQPSGNAVASTITATTAVQNVSFIETSQALAATPTVMAAAGTYDLQQTVTLTSSTPGSTILYTTDGSDPATSSLSVSSGGTVVINQSETLKAIAIATGYLNSNILIAAYTINQPTIPVDGMELWLKADAGTTDSTGQIAAVNGSIARWLDQSPKHQDAVQATSANQPVLSTMAGGQKTVSFDGVSEYFCLPSGFSDLTQGITIFSVMTASSNSFQNIGAVLQLGIADGSDSVYLTQQGAYLLMLNTSNSLSAASSSLLDNLPQEITAINNMSSITFYQNGALQSQYAASPLNNVLRTSNYIGNGDFGDPYFQGNIAEILIYHRALNDDERQNVELYLAVKYHLPYTLPAPVITPNGSTSLPVTVGISSSHVPAVVRYTLDGTDPTSSSTLYTQPFSIPASMNTTTVTAAAFLGDIKVSDSSSASFFDQQIVDTDTDGLPDAWEMQYFGHLGNNPNSSPDGNGLTLLQDYQYGLDPTNYYSQLDSNGNAVTVIPTLTLVSGNNQISAAGAFTDQPLVIRVTNSATGLPLPNAPYTFNVCSGGGLVALTRGYTDASGSLSSQTDMTGLSHVYYQAPSSANSSSTIAASVLSQSVTFTESSSGGDGVADAPDHIVAQYASPTEVDLTWVNHASSATGIVIEQSTDNSTWTTAAVLSDPTATTYAVTGLMANQTYYFRIGGTK